MSDTNKGMALGFLAVAGFALTLPATRILVAHTSPLFAAFGRAAIGGVIAAALLYALNQPWPNKRQFFQLLVVASGVALGFPLLSAMAMMEMKASHGGVIVGVAPILTTAVGAIAFGERPSRSFWMAALAGCALVIIFTASKSGQPVTAGDLALFGAVIFAAIGYASGGHLARTMGGWQVICWALVIMLPITLIPTILLAPENPLTMPLGAWVALSYLGIVSQLVAFFAWNHGLAIGGIARVSQTQLLQPFLTIAGSALLLGEAIEARTMLFALMVITTVLISKKTAVQSIKQTPNLDDSLVAETVR